MLTIDGMALPAPCEMRVGYEMVGRTETTADGALAADRLAMKRRAEFVWRGLEREDAELVLSSLSQGVFLSVTMPDPRAGAAVSLTMTLLRLDTELMRAEESGIPVLCKTITAVLRER